MRSSSGLRVSPFVAMLFQHISMPHRIFDLPATAASCSSGSFHWGRTSGLNPSLPPGKLRLVESSSRHEDINDNPHEIDLALSTGIFALGLPDHYSSQELLCYGASCEKLNQHVGKAPFQAENRLEPFLSRLCLGPQLIQNHIHCTHFNLY